jgi:putative DNA primase/helicase
VSMNTLFPSDDLDGDDDEIQIPKTNLSTVPAPALVDVKNVDADDLDMALTDFSERDLAKIFVKKHGINWKWIDTWGVWMEYNGGRWIQNKRRGFSSAVQNFMDGIPHWPSFSRAPESVRKAVATRKVEANVREKCKDNETMNDVKEIFDADDYIVGTPEGVIDLRKGKFREAERTDYITKRTSVSPKSGPMPAWDRHLDFVCKGDSELRHYLHKLFGMLLCGDRSEQCFTFFYGGGGNGKGAMLRQVVGILGDYAVEANASTFMEQRNVAHLTEVAHLEGARLAYVDETPQGVTLNEERIQKLTGGSKMAARKMGQDMYEFQPKCYIIMVGNFKPRLKTSGQSMKRRTHLFPCLNSIQPGKEDHSIEDAMRAEWPAILHWMLEGFKLWKAEGLKREIPVAISRATDDYMDAEDTVGEWIESSADRTDADAKTNRTTLYNAYKEWSGKQGYDHPMGPKNFYESIETKGFGIIKSSGVRYVSGLKLKDDAEQAQWGYSNDN